ncbi:MAG: EAL domain-containing protein [Lachnospiraceae bacterium]|nr:EAL domain-containing protein [Lachnospiraceae bacterium]
MEHTNEITKHIAEALAGRYEVIYYVDIVTNEYWEFVSTEKYARLNVGETGSDFFGETQRNMKRDIFPDDLPMMAKSMDKDTLLTNLKEKKKIYIDYRLMLEGRPQYMTLIAVSIPDDDKHIVVAVDNVDAQKQKELAFERVIGSTMDMANKDSLTGVKNKHSYVQLEMQMDDQIAGDFSPEFAVVVCDINGLKQVNDEQGHNAGDAYIKSASAIICKTFAHSPVYRIGGDEFVAVLKGSDYEERHKLIANLGKIVLENKEKGLVTIAYGMADYRPKKDNRFQDIFERADTLMYENKRVFKHGKEIVKREDDSEAALKFYILYQKLVSAMTEINQVDIKLIENTLIDIAAMFRLSKGVTRVYKNRQEEMSGGGETLCCFDTGEEGVEISSMRVVTSVMTITTMTVYMSPDVEPLTEEEKWRVELVMRTTISFISKNRMKDMVEELAFYDESGYPNLRNLTQYIMKNAAMHKIQGCVSFRYNLRHFSIINQEFGREYGDKVLRKHYDDLKKIMGEDSIIARLGGDNFVGICSGERLDAVKTFLTEAEIRPDDGDPVVVQTTAGIFCVPQDYEVQTLGDILAKIINAYTGARHFNKGSIVFYDEELLKKRQQILKVQQLLPEALKNKEFKTYYQPKVNIVTGKLNGAEALCRWFHEGSMVMPNDFIPMLEDSSDICKLDFYMLERVCEDIRRWLDEGKNVVRISVNFSRKHIMNIGLPEAIEEIVDRHNIPHKYIEIELTETTADVAFGDLKRIATKLHDMGFYTAVDDFGVGYSSLNLICEIPWNVLKIDRSFIPVKEDSEDSYRMILFKHVVSITRQMGLECIAEGVETVDQIKIIKDNNCELVQGYYFDRPLPVEDFEKRLIESDYKVSCFF